MTQQAQPPTFASRAKEIANVIAPISVITALLVYFGYIGTKARFEYFGLYLDLTNLSNRDLMLYGMEVVYVPAALAFLTLFAALAGHTGIRFLLSHARTAYIQLFAAFFALLGLALTGRAVAGILAPEIARLEIPATTPLTLAAGPALITYACWIAVQTTHGRRPAFTNWYDSAPIAATRRTTLVAVAGVAVAGLFWAANSFAWAFGSNRGYQDALDLPSRPELVVDTTEPLTDLPANVTQTRLSTDKASKYQYRYRGLRLLLQSDNRLFAVPSHWTANSRTMIIPYDTDIRVQVIPAPQ
jgi:hypothetical protein